jgi:hypothetical protein
LSDISYRAAVILLAGPPADEDSCGKGTSLAVNFLQKTAEQRGTTKETPAGNRSTDRSVAYTLEALQLERERLL